MEGQGQSGNEQFNKKQLFCNSGVGKSCMLMRYVDNNFTTNFFNTIGVDFKMKSIIIDGESWDTAGQERFKTITCNYYNGAHGIVVVYDITDRESFNSVKMWMGEIKKYAQPNVIKILVGNKKDLEDKRTVTIEEGQELAKFYGVDFLETSAKDTTNIEESFVTLSRSIIKKINKKLEEPDDIQLEQKKRSKVNDKCC